MKNGVKVWIINIKGGDRKAFEKLFLRFYEPLCQFSWQFTHSRHISEELVQEVFMAVWKSRKTLDPQKDIKSYLYQSVRNKALNYIEHEQLAEEYNREIEWLSPAPVTQKHHYGEKSQFEKAAKKAIEHLPDRARQIYKLSRKDGLTYREIADVMDISVKTVESQMSRALKILRNSLSQYL
ncbi:RNA polymerase sigma-70 factor [Fodinibius sp.]|uniref:RNA polymerase sigma-70 factor n=1 Tax=Fodinibius sp. TaxID=1872440 RepID=UPI003569F223